MSTKLKTALLFGTGMTFLFSIMSFTSILKGDDETTAEMVKSFEAALAAGFATGVLAYFFSDKLKDNKLFGKKNE